MATGHEAEMNGMSGSVIADFVANAVFDDGPRRDPVRSRVLLGEDRLVVATENDRRTVPLSAIFDVSVSQVPRNLEDFVDQSVRVGYADDGVRRTLVLQGSHDTIDKFSVGLYRQILEDADAKARHPAKQGGRLTENDFRPVAVKPGRSDVTVRSSEGSFQIGLHAITDVTRVERSVDGTPEDVVSVRYWDGAQALTTEFTYDEPKRRSVLARYLRLRTHGAQETLADATVDEAAEEALVALYAGAPRDRLPAILDRDPADVEALVTELEAQRLVADAEAGTLTAAGRLVVAKRYDAD